MEALFFFSEAEGVLQRSSVRMINMRFSRNTTGIALLLVLMIVVISAGLLAAIAYYTLSGTEISGLQKKYQTSKEASIGSIEILTREIAPRVLRGESLSTLANVLKGGSMFPAGSIVPGVTNDCFNDKLTKNTSDWWSASAGNCGPKPTDQDLINPTKNPDATFTLKGTAGEMYEIQTKIVDGSKGNSDVSGNVFLNSGVADSGGSGGNFVEHLPGLYTILTEARLKSGVATQNERANFEVLYAY